MTRTDTEAQRNPLTAYTAFEKVVNPGICEDGRIFCKIEFDGKRLSITGVVGPLRNGNARGSCGQISMPVIQVYSFGWDKETAEKFWQLWDRWHLNDMRAACEHQRQRGETWATHPSAECPDCGYKLGHAWLFEAVPLNVLSWLYNLPETEFTPAWI